MRFFRMVGGSQVVEIIEFVFFRFGVSIIFTVFLAHLEYNIGSRWHDDCTMGLHDEANSRVAGEPTDIGRKRRG